MTTLIEAQELTKKYSVRLFSNLSLSVNHGEVLVIRGNNGSGKSTLLKILAGITEPTHGTIKRMKPDLIISYVPEKFPDDIRFTAKQYLYHMGRIQGLTKPELQDRISSLLRQFRLESEHANAIHTFSKGMKQKVGIMQALLAKPDILLLDEPLSGLDTGTQDDLESILYQLKLDGMTILVACHEQKRFNSIVDRGIILGDQPIQSEYYPAGELPHRVIIQADTNAQKLDFLYGIAGVIDKEPIDDGDVIRLDVEPFASDRILLALIQHGCSIQSLHTESEK
ncbi:ABC transporter ATP-binding protein [Barrientosiimonas marina]|uniref:ATP-binding cassette domain-containing protein n=1 Tax=Lentibacillus kimchii TaxID=1542911 RepID=A0ABW2UTD5_9BACI